MTDRPNEKREVGVKPAPPELYPLLDATERRYVSRLNHRIRWLEKRIAEWDGKPGGHHHDAAELAATKWAIEVVDMLYRKTPEDEAPARHLSDGEHTYVPKDNRPSSPCLHCQRAPAAPVHV